MANPDCQGFIVSKPVLEEGSFVEVECLCMHECKLLLKCLRPGNLSGIMMVIEQLLRVAILALRWLSEKGSSSIFCRVPQT